MLVLKPESIAGLFPPNVPHGAGCLADRLFASRPPPYHPVAIDTPAPPTYRPALHTAEMPGTKGPAESRVNLPPANRARPGEVGCGGPCVARRPRACGTPPTRSAQDASGPARVRPPRRGSRPGHHA